MLYKSLQGYQDMFTSLKGLPVELFKLQNWTFQITLWAHRHQSSNKANPTYYGSIVLTTYKINEVEVQYYEMRNVREEHSLQSLQVDHH